MRPARLARMTRHLAFASALAWTLSAFAGGAGCSSTSSNPGAPDGASRAVLDAGGSECEMAGGQCIAGSATCWGLEGFADCGNGAVCCKVVFDAGSCTDANAEVVMASSYDQSCASDSDCVGISEGNSCQPCDFSCSNATINAGALAKYTSDTAHFPAVVAFDHGVCPSSCGGPVGLCCLGGKCHRGSPCPFEVLMGGDAGADAGDAAATDGSVVDANVE